MDALPRRGVLLVSVLVAAVAALAPALAPAVDLPGVDEATEQLEGALPADVPSAEDHGSTVSDVVGQVEDAVPVLGDEPPADSAAGGTSPSNGAQQPAPIPPASAEPPPAPGAAPGGSTSSAAATPPAGAASAPGGGAPGGDAGAADTGGAASAPAASESQHSPGPDPATSAGSGDTSQRSAPAPAGPLAQTIAELPSTILVAMLALAALGLAMAGRSAWLALAARRLRAREGELRADIGVLQSALVPELPERIAGVGVSAAYRSAAGLAAGGDFLDLLELDEERIAVIVGDVSGHDRDAVTPTALVHYTVRAYVAAGLEPRDALRLTDQALTGRLGPHYATVLAAIYDGRRGALRYALAGHPAPIVIGERADHAIEALTPPPIGLGPLTGYRQTEVWLGAGSRICLFTDGLPEAHDGGGELIGREGLRAMLEALGREGGATQVLERLAPAASPRDDMTVCLLQPSVLDSEVQVVDELELDGKRAREPALADLLAECGLGADEVERVRVAIAGEVDDGPVRLTVRRAAAGPSWSIDRLRPQESGSLVAGETEHDRGQFVQLVPNRI